MPRWLKVILVVFVLGGLAVFGSCSACAYWFKSASEEFKADMIDVEQQAREAYEGGRRLGAGLDDANLCFGHGEEALNACAASADEALMARSKCINNAKFRVRGCVDAARSAMGLCDEVPRQLNFQQLLEEQAQQCPPGAPATCQTLFQTRVEICEGRARQREAEAAATAPAQAVDAADLAPGQ